MKELTVHYFDGEEYQRTKNYLLKHGCAWSEKRGNGGELLSIHLDFPPKTEVRELESSNDLYKRHQVMFPDGSFMYWSMERESKKNRISVAYSHL